MTQTVDIEVELLEALQAAAIIINAMAAKRLPTCFVPDRQVVKAINDAIARATDE